MAQADLVNLINFSFLVGYIKYIAIQTGYVQLTIDSFLKFSGVKNFIVHSSFGFWDYKDISVGLIN